MKILSESKSLGQNNSHSRIGNCDRIFIYTKCPPKFGPGKLMAAQHFVAHKLIAQTRRITEQEIIILNQHHEILSDFFFLYVCDSDVVLLRKCAIFLCKIGQKWQKTNAN